MPDDFSPYSSGTDKDKDLDGIIRPHELGDFTGQDKIVTVFSLIAKGTIEEKIRHLQEMKRELAEQVLAGENGTLGSLRREELLELLADTP